MKPSSSVLWGAYGSATWAWPTQTGFPWKAPVYLGADGFGSDDLAYYDDGEPFGVYNIQWDAYDGNLYISYGNVAPPRELHDVRVRRGLLTGDLFINGYFYGEVSLRMQ